MCFLVLNITDSDIFMLSFKLFFQVQELKWRDSIKRRKICYFTLPWINGNSALYRLFLQHLLLKLTFFSFFTAFFWNPISKEFKLQIITSGSLVSTTMMFA